MVNRLYYGDNVDAMRQHIKDESVGLAYLDPPFTSNRTYTSCSNTRQVRKRVLIAAFDDTWTWSQSDDVLYAELRERAAPKVGDTILAMRSIA